jgi:hypothetical protein
MLQYLDIHVSFLFSHGFSRLLPFLDFLFLATSRGYHPSTFSSFLLILGLLFSFPVSAQVRYRGSIEQELGTG